MPRLSDSLQRPTTLLTLKKSKESLISYVSAARGQLILMTDAAGTLNGEMRVSSGSSKPGLDQYGNPITLSITAPVYPVGSIIYFAGPEPPAGWLFCNGAVLRRDLYSELSDFLDAHLPTSEFYVSPTHFKLPDYTNSHNYNQGGLFIRNLNEGGPYGNTVAPDWYEHNEYDYYQKGEYKTTMSFIDRQFGSIQQEKYHHHNHNYITANTANLTSILTGETGEVHSHRYFGTEGATNGIQLGNLNSQGVGKIAIIARSDIGTTDHGADTPVRAFPINPNINAANPGTDPKVHDFNVAATIPMPPPTGQEFNIGEHLHVGWIGFGTGYTANLHNTFHHTANNVNNQQYIITSSNNYIFDQTANNFNNMRETQPKNYSVLFCIKY